VRRRRRPQPGRRRPCRPRTGRFPPRRGRARYTDRVGGEAADDLIARLESLLADAYRDGDHARARVAYTVLIDHARSIGADKVARHLTGALDEALTS
jgi:hypothetical protein